LPENKDKSAKKKAKNLEEKLLLKKVTSWEKADKKKREMILSFAEDYKKFLDAAKTEREAVNEIVRFAKKNGFVPIEEIYDKKAIPGTRIYAVNHAKSVALAVIGKKPLSEGISFIGSHIDSPRIDLKGNPLYEDTDSKLAVFKTHYYGGIRKYQWVNVPLAIHGKVILSNGKDIDIVIGENDNEPVLVIPDLLPHLARNLAEKRKSSETIKGEELNVIVGSIPVKDEKVKTRVKLAVLQHLNQKYGIVEEDFSSAEIELVPAQKARDVGLDSSMLGAYGQDDRVCAYTSLRALVDIDIPNRTSVALFFDKEEIGSEGNTGAKSRFLENFVGDLLASYDINYHDSSLRKVFAKSEAISADVNAAVDPTFKEVHEMLNASKFGYGITITKYTGSGGKSSSNDAHAEFVGKIRHLLNKNKIIWQTAGLGKVDEGGGGTIAKFLAEYGMNVIDAGTALISMHSPFEIASKADIYETYLAYQAFFRDA